MQRVRFLQVVSRPEKKLAASHGTVDAPNWRVSGLSADTLKVAAHNLADLLALWPCRAELPLFVELLIHLLNTQCTTRLYILSCWLIDAEHS